MARMDFLLRSARIVELDGGPGWVGPVDLLVEAGASATSTTTCRARPGSRRSTPAAAG